MLDSPCHHCERCPCKEHDTCKEYLEYRAAQDRRNKENMKLADYKDYVCQSIIKTKRKYRR